MRREHCQGELQTDGEEPTAEPKEEMFEGSGQGCVKRVIGVIGGGIAGSTIALKLGEIGVRSILFEEGPSLVNGPPMCHLHAGGNLYREIPDEQCLILLKQAIETIKCYPASVNRRPTLFTIPLRDSGTLDEVLRRLKLLKQAYTKLVAENPASAVLGNPEHYYKIYSEDDIKKLRKLEVPSRPATLDDWLIPPAKNLDLSKFKFPFVMVQEPGWSSLRVSAHANLALAHMPHCELKLSTKVTGIQQNSEKSQWNITYKAINGEGERQEQVKVDYLVNCCGYRTGQIDDLVGVHQERMLEFKAAYLTEWKSCKGYWPEVIIHGVRNTPHGMAQLTPYADNVFQIHGMTKQITLFEGGLSQTNGRSAMPELQEKYQKILEEGWEPEQIEIRTNAAIQFVTEFIPSFADASVAGKPLYGAQQIPGTDIALRASAVSFEGPNYARAQIVKASSAITAAHKIIEHLNFKDRSSVHCHPPREEILAKAQQLSRERNYPEAISKEYFYSGDAN